MIEFGAYLEATAAMSGNGRGRGIALFPKHPPTLLGPALD
jgi:hypothetical protein